MFVLEWVQRNWNNSLKCSLIDGFWMLLLLCCLSRLKVQLSDTPQGTRSPIRHHQKRNVNSNVIFSASFPVWGWICNNEGFPLIKLLTGWWSCKDKWSFWGNWQTVFVGYGWDAYLYIRKLRELDGVINCRGKAHS